MYVNEVSFFTEPKPHLIHNCMSEFFKLIKKLYEMGVDEFYVTSDIKLLPETYPISKWLNFLDRDEKRVIIGLLSKLKEKNLKNFSELEAEIDGKSCSGLLGALLDSDEVISLNSHEKWAKNELLIHVMRLLDSGEMSYDFKVIQNFYSCQQDFSDYENYILKEKFRIYDYQELWNKKEIMFPHLKFCPSIEKKLYMLDKQPIKQILSKLKSLDEYAQNLETNPFGFADHNKITPESPVTLDKFRKEHTFRDENGDYYLASWHMRFTGMAGRIYFVPDEKHRTILICHIGKKLPNVSYAT